MNVTALGRGALSTVEVCMSQNSSRRGRRGSDRIVAAALAAGSTVQDAAQVGQMSERTVRRRLLEPAFRAEVSRLQCESIQGIASDLRGAAAQATRTLIELLEAGTADTVRLAAARTILDHAVRYHDAADVEQRVLELESRLGLTTELRSA